MEKIFIVLLLLIVGNINAQGYRGDYEEWSIEFSAGLNKPYNTMTPGYGTSNPNLFHIDLGTRYTITPYIGIKADIGYDAFNNKPNTPVFNGNYIRFNIQAVCDLGYTLGIYDNAKPIGILVHSGFGVSQLQTDYSTNKDRMGNFIFGLTGTLKITDDISLSGDLSSLMHIKQSSSFDGRTESYPSKNFAGNLLNSSLGFIYFFRK